MMPTELNNKAFNITYTNNQVARWYISIIVILWNWTGTSAAVLDVLLVRQPKRVSNSLQWRHSGRNSVSNHQPHHYSLNRLFRRRSKKTPKLRITGLCAGNSPVTGEFPAQIASNAENVSIWWRHHILVLNTTNAFYRQNEWYGPQHQGNWHMVNGKAGAIIQYVIV